MDIQAAPDFPSREWFTDCAGVRRLFELDVRHLPNHGYAAEAREVTTSDHGGYVFEAFAEASGTMAVVRLRIKVRQGLAQRFLIKKGSTMEMPFERIRGRIDAEGVVVVDVGAERVPAIRGTRRSLSVFASFALVYRFA
jgi:hypothetical protein